MRTASFNSVNTTTFLNVSSEQDNYAKEHFLNRASKINLSLNRLPYDNANGDLQPCVENGDPLNRPLGLNYGGNDFNKANPDYNENPPQTSVDVTHLIPGDRVNYYITAINDKDDTATEQGEMRESVSWTNPVLRFEAPEGMRIARWVYMPDDFPIGKVKDTSGKYVDQPVARVDLDGHYLNDQNEPLKNGDDYVTDPNDSRIGTQPLSALEKDCGDPTYSPITSGDIEAYDPHYSNVPIPEDQELKDVYSGKEMERPNLFSRIRTFFTRTKTPDNVVKTLV